MFGHDFLHMSLGCGVTLSTGLLCATWVFARLMDAMLQIIDAAMEAFPPRDDFDQSNHIA